MVREISFKNLPFTPVDRQVIYVEQSYNEKLNKFIRNNYDWLKTIFRSQRLEFCFLPLLAEEAIAYNAPYLTAEEIHKQISAVSSLADFLAGNNDESTPGLVFALDTPVVDKDGNTILHILPIKTKWFTRTASTFWGLAKEINKTISEEQSKRRHETERKRKAEGEEHRYGLDERQDGDIHYSISTIVEDPGDDNQEFGLHFSIKNSEEADSNFDVQSQLLIDEIKQRIEALRNRGVNTMFLHNLIDEGERLSRLRITKDFRIFLVDYDNLEIKLPILPKSVFILFLRHPEGIRFKELTDYYAELLQIYLMMNPNGGRSKQEQSVRDITDPCSNSINEKCARIREAFVTNFDDRLAKNYYVTGKRGEAKRITLDESMILWEK